MILPEIPYPKNKTRRQITNFLGLNLSENTTEGELVNSLGLSTEGFPCLTQREGRGEIAGYAAPEDIFEWDGKLIVANDGLLYYDGDPLCNVAPGKKQFAVVGSRLCVWPDKLMVDLTNKEISHMDEIFVTTGAPGSAVFTANTLTAASEPQKAHDITWRIPGDTSNRHTLIYTYGADRAAVEACYTGGAWNLTALDAIQSCKSFYSTSRDPYVSGLVGVGDIVIPQSPTQEWWGTSYRAVTGLWLYEDEDTGEEYISYPDRGLYNSDGIYGVVTSRTRESGTTTIELVLDFYAVGADAPLFSSVFYVGDTLTITGTKYGWYDRDKLAITAISDVPNMLSFGEGTVWEAPVCVREPSSFPISAGKKRIRFDLNGSTNYFHFELPEEEDDENIVLIVLSLGSSYSTVFWDMENKVEKYRLATTASSGTISGEQSLGTAEAYDTQTEHISIKRDVPQFDYICAWNNRLWGAANNEMNRVWNEEKEEWEESYSRVLYASALGQPWQFYDYSGLTTDSYAVAVASEGEFTAICAYSRSLLAWKEERLVKIMGDYPAEYYLQEYTVAGVQKGSHRSCVIINDVLYFKGVFGVYAYTGGTPALISAKLGNGRYAEGVGGTDGKCYYLDVKTAAGEYFMLKYDVIRGLWMREDNIGVSAFATVGGLMHFLSGDKIYTAGDPESTEKVSWLAEFVPFTETEHITKGYTKLLFRLDMATGSSMQIEICEDRKPWRVVWRQPATRAVTLNVPVRLGRCDRFRVRLTGEGRVTIRSMAREFTAGSEVLKV